MKENQPTNGHGNGNGSAKTKENHPTPGAPGASGKASTPPKKTQKKQGSLGPVPNLEEYVRPDWWRNIFNSTYLKTDGDLVEDLNITRTEIDLFLSILNIPQETKLLDLCCGQGRHVLELSRRGFTNLYGLDRSNYLIQKAKKQCKKEGLKVNLREGDARKLPFSNDEFDIVTILGNSFGYFENLNDDLRILRDVFRILKPDGRIFIDIADGEHLKQNFQPRSWEWIDKKHFVCRERSLSFDENRLISREVVTHVEKGVLVDQFYAERLYQNKDLEKLLTTVGFSKVSIHAPIFSKTERNQDLGMMAKRLLVTAEVKKEWTKAKKKTPKPTKNVVVVMGDPTKSDMIKRGGTFNPEDFETIEMLKKALKNLEMFSYKFDYLNRHDSLIQDLTKLKGKVDYIFNICDEGFDNEARKELHIPAILEILNIPYTGSAPQSLAYCYDKSLVRGIANEMGIPTPKAFFVQPETSLYELPFAFPVIVKPNWGDSSIGITKESVAYSIQELMDAITLVREKMGFDKPLLVEEFLTGKDLTLGILGNPTTSYTVFPIIEEDYSDLPPDLPKICGYEAKWLPDSPYFKCLKSVPANLPEETEKLMIECSLALMKRLECKDYVRMDWRLDGRGHPKLLEVNPNPGWCWDGHLAKMAKLSNLEYNDLLHCILIAAEQRLGMEKEKEGGPLAVKKEREAEKAAEVSTPEKSSS